MSYFSGSENIFLLSFEACADEIVNDENDISNNAEVPEEISADLLQEEQQDVEDKEVNEDSENEDTEDEDTEDEEDQSDEDILEDEVSGFLNLRHFSPMLSNLTRARMRFFEVFTLSSKLSKCL